MLYSASVIVADSGAFIKSCYEGRNKLFAEKNGGKITGKDKVRIV